MSVSLLRTAWDAIHAPIWQGNKVVLTGLIDQSNVDFDDKWSDKDDALATCLPYYAKLPALQAAIQVRLALACARTATMALRDDDGACRAAKSPARPNRRPARPLG